VARRAIAPVASFAAMGLLWGSWAALVPEVKADLDAPDGPFGLALLSVGAGSLPAMLLAGHLWGRLGRKLLVVSAAAFGLATLLVLPVDSLPKLALALGALGAASGALDVAMNSEVSELEASSGRRLMYGAHAVFSLGVLIGSVGTGIVREGGGDRSVILPLVAGVFFAIAVLGWWSPGPQLKLAEPHDSRPRRWPAWIVALGALCAGSFLIEDALQSWSALHLERTLGASPILCGAGPGVFGGSMFLGRSAGQLIGRWLTERMLVVGGGLGTAVGAALAALAPTPAVALMGFAIAGTSISLVAPALFARAGRLAGDRGRGAAISTLTTIGYMGFLVGPGAFGAVAGATSLTGAFLATAGLALLLGAGGYVIVTPARDRARDP
jgi:MFS family permease